MRRVVSVNLPTWSTDRWRRKRGSPRLEVPFVMVGRENSRRVVLAADAAARSAGVHPGIPAAQAQAALVPGLIIQNADPDDDRKALDRLAVGAAQYRESEMRRQPDSILATLD
jgi:protein ImuB